MVRELYAALDAPLILTNLRTAEMVKYVDNSWHALKVTFANEVGRLCKAMGIDARLAMRLFCMDAKLNISSAYLRPGFAFGGSCLPKDVRALTYQGRLLDVDTPGYELTVYDQNVRLASLVGANREYILNHIPHIGRLMVDRPEQLLEHCDVVVVASADREFGPLLENLPAGKSVIDLVGAWNAAEGKSTAHMDAYDGIAW
jgi:GDP-mannose 6-dehydrogenase